MNSEKIGIQRKYRPEYYQYTGNYKIAVRLSLKARKKIFGIFSEKFNPSSKLNILDVGVTSDSFNPESNFFEQFYPFKEQITCVGIEDNYWIESKYPGLKYLKIEPNEALPFKNKQFDISFSNAVIEHVGNTDSQQRFISELRRVSRAFFITTPNRWFPIEMHTMLPFIHYLPATWWRKIMGILRYKFYSHETSLNLLDKQTLLQLFPSDKTIEVIEVRTLGLVSNIVVVKKF